VKSAVIVFPASNCDRDAATALEQIKLINDNVKSLVTVTIDSAQNTQSDVQTLMHSDLSAGSDEINAMNLALQELVFNMQQCTKAIGNSVDQTGYVKQLDDIAVHMTQISAKFTACQTTIQHNMQEDAEM